MQAPLLKTTRLTLNSPLYYDGMDVTHYLRWLSDRVVTQYSEQRHVKHTEQTQRDYLRSIVSSSNGYFWDITKNGSNIGTITASIDLPNKTAQMGILLGEKQTHGHGLGAEAWNAVSEFLFGRGIRKVEAGCMACNAPMRAVLHKTGFSHETTVKGHFLLFENPHDMVTYGKFRTAQIVPFKFPQ